MAVVITRLPCLLKIFTERKAGESIRKEPKLNCHCPSEADNSADSYFGLGILRSADGGNTWTLIPTANAGTYSFSGLGATRLLSAQRRPARWLRQWRRQRKA
jgi:hypothetical protein